MTKKKKPAPASGWRPIETAPNETPVWLTDASGSIWIGERGYDSDGWLWGNTYMAVYQRTDGTWASSSNEWDDDYQPTHWQPLPAPSISTGEAMSGGSFGHAYIHVRSFAEALDDKMQDEPPEPEIDAALRAVSAQAAKFAEVMRAVEWYYSCDIGPETLLERLEKHKL